MCTHTCTHVSSTENGQFISHQHSTYRNVPYNQQFSLHQPLTLLSNPLAELRPDAEVSVQSLGRQKSHDSGETVGVRRFLEPQ